MSNAPKNLAWQPWKPNDLAEPISKSVPTYQVNDEPEVPAIERFNEENAVPTLEDELASLRESMMQQARETGFSQGHQQGYDAGYQEGLAKGQQQGLQNSLQQQQPIIEQMQQMVTEFQQTLDTLDSVIPARLMQLALTAAKQILGQPPVCDGNALLGQIQQLLQQEPMFSGKTQLRVHPSDLERVEQYLGPTLSLHGWRLLADSQLHPGGCKVSAEEGDLDASLATRWHELCRLAAPGEL
ncbi:flagellar assembly protein [Pectobacterium atrosepticum SCRI1043]|uniref:Flagellar assembly protein FliH n=1 Tax=Pectobacterium atrosepticum (strain SCRI 1043 / ATCC BAA-672) TaxID=218491 RepID=Q6D6G1_PECAS|nr:flagellar assembly protein FliH [Pectobacterium atrosepticum]GKV84174.1 flagellar assembly protein FliH [Pectobacterium carotovorum subsp. carotovorum]AIA70572.1 flagellar assembly protein H [Pectobacterium atrosepticum]AIK14662.1 flagellar assembly protein FliH [Pectobacterium atrosepticum]ATY91402.1 flagellar assembly protein FliH [Pectobacterium atrosepticum]KFX17662.1 flagellar assembly protein H [Pectobacterium atrosepticum]